MWRYDFFHSIRGNIMTRWPIIKDATNGDGLWCFHGYNRNQRKSRRGKICKPIAYFSYVTPYLK